MAGTQSIERACELLKQIARFGSRGSSLSVLSKGLGIPHPTCHRMLKSLVEVGLAHFDPQTKLYRIGPLAFELGLVAVTPFGQMNLYQPIIAEVAEKTHDTAYLFIRRAEDIVCMLRVEGSYMIKANIVEVGGRRPICDSVAGIAMLASLTDEEAHYLIKKSRAYVTEGVRLDIDQIEERMAFAKETGIAFWSSVVMPDVAGAAIAVPSPDGSCYLGIAISAMASRLTEERVKDIRPVLQSARDKLSQVVSWQI